MAFRADPFLNPRAERFCARFVRKGDTSRGYVLEWRWLDAHPGIAWE